MLQEKIDEMIRERISGGDGFETGLEEILLVQMLTGNQQGLDVNSLLPLLLLGKRGGFGRRRGIGRLALLALLASQQAQAAANVSGVGGAPQSSNTTLLPLLLALGLFGEDRDDFRSPLRRSLNVEGVEDNIVEEKEVKEVKRGG
jgi:hypothetical protein